MILKIEQVLDKSVRPALQEHGGDVRIDGFADGTLRIEFLGRCSGCPAASLTTEQFIREEVQNALPEIKDVVLVQSVSEDLLDMAYKILRHDI